jgi:hypothetical protein
MAFDGLVEAFAYVAPSAAAAAGVSRQPEPMRMLLAHGISSTSTEDAVTADLPAAGAAAAGFGLHALLIVCAFCAGVSGNLFDTAALVTNVKNFPNDR